MGQWLKPLAVDAGLSVSFPTAMSEVSGITHVIKGVIMTAWNNGVVSLHMADSRALPIEDKSVHTVVTSPPYWGLRDYGTDGQLGLEPTPEEFCNSMVAVFREVRRVLRDDGTVWLNLGDSYSGGSRTTTTNDSLDKGIKPKDLIGMPWRVAFALQADGWYLRSDIIWSKPNPMPESVTDRPTKAHEYVFLLTKQAKYYYDADAIRETNGKESSWDNYGGKGFINHPTGDARHQVDLAEGMSQRMVKPNTTHPNGRNKRSVWEISTQPYAEAHFATYPEKLVEPCILAGTSEKGVCAECGKPWERIVELTKEYAAMLASDKAWRTNEGKPDQYTNRHPKKHPENVPQKHNTVGWQPTCECNAEIVPATVLDPFVGSGTTLAVAQRLGRRGVGADINEEYLSLARNRLEKISMPMSM